MPWEALIWTLAPIGLILALLVVWKMSADVSGILGWAAVSAVAYFVFQTSGEVIFRSTAAGFIRSMPVSMIVATSLLQMAYMEKTGALRRIILFIRTIACSNRAVQVMLVNIGFGTLMVSVGATPVSLLPPILLAMGYSTYTAIALPAIGYDSLCTYALLGAPIVVFVDIASAFLGKGKEITLSQAGMAFYPFLPVISTMIGFCMLWIVGRWQAVKEGMAPCLLTGATIAGVAYFTSRYDNLVVLTGVLCGVAVILVMAVYLKLRGEKIVDESRLTAEERQFMAQYPLGRALMPWLLLVGLILALNLPQESFTYLYRVLKMPVAGVTANGAGIDTRALWNAYTWIFVSTVLSMYWIRPTAGQLRETWQTWLRRAPRPVFSAAVFFAIGEIMNMSGYSMSTGKFETASMVKVLADFSAAYFSQAYGAVVPFIGLFGGFVTGSEASTIAMFAKYTLTTGVQLQLGLTDMIIITAGLAFGGGLASVISPAKLQNAAAAIDRLGEENQVIRLACVFSIGLVSLTALFVVLLLGKA